MLQFDLQFYEKLTVAWVRTVKFISGAFFWPTGQLVCSTYDLNKYDISLSLLSKLKDNDEECAIQRASTIVDFLHYYDTYPEQSVWEIVNYLCTFKKKIFP